MEGLLEVNASTPNLYSLSINTGQDQADLLVLDATLSSHSFAGADQVDISPNDLTKGLAISAQKILEKLNELLKKSLPDGIESLSPEEVTPEATAERIVQGATAFFDVFAKQNPDLTSEELLTKFMDTVRGGIQAGYDDAYHTLKDLGAFEFEGVEDGIKQTKDLIEEKLKAYEDYKRKELGLESSNEEQVQQIAKPTAEQLLAQAGARTLSTIA